MKTKLFVFQLMDSTLFFTNIGSSFFLMINYLLLMAVNFVRFFIKKIQNFSKIFQNFQKKFQKFQKFFFRIFYFIFSEDAMGAND